MTAEKQSALQTIEEKKSLITGIADKIWGFAELSLQEFKSAETYCEALEKEGFEVERLLRHLMATDVRISESSQSMTRFQGFLRKQVQLSEKRSTSAVPAMDADITSLVQELLRQHLE